MNEGLLSNAWQQVCDNLLALRKARDWAQEFSSFDEYVAERWSLSKSRAKVLCNYSILCKMCREKYIKVPDSPDNVRPILELPQYQWLDAWQRCQEKLSGTPNAKQVYSVLEFYGMGIKRRVPPEVAKARKVRKAAKLLAEMEDGEKLVDEIGASALGHDWDMGLRVAIDADQAKMDKRRKGEG